MYGMTPVGVFFTAIFPLVINDQAFCQQPHFVPKYVTRRQNGAVTYQTDCTLKSTAAC